MYVVTFATKFFRTIERYTSCEQNFVRVEARKWMPLHTTKHLLLFVLSFFLLCVVLQVDF